MKWMIASDIHGSATYCAQMTARFAEEKADRLLLLGDILYHGPRNALPEGYAPAQVIALLTPLADKICCVRGNCEAEVDQMVLPFPVMADYAMLCADNQLAYATHGHVYGPQNPPKLPKGTLLFSGHTHVPLWEEKDGICFCNPGSVAIPKENSPHSYVIWQDGEVLWKDVTDGVVYRRQKITTP